MGPKMRIKIRVTPNSKREGVERQSDGSYKVRVREKATEGRANAAAVAALSRHFNVSASAVRILKGKKSRDKDVELPL